MTAAPRLNHIVFFLLKDRAPERVEELVAACQKYLNVQPGILFFSVGSLAHELKREVNDLNWDVALQILFVDQAAHDAYQVDPTHELFIQTMKANWASVRVFDAIVTP
ncbi:MAG: Dabb family protein [Gemmataceae bacterium]